MPENEKIALIGDNGSGKTTLLKVLLGQEEADSGEIIKPSRLSLGSLSQEANRNPKPTILEEAMEGAYKFLPVKKELEKLTQKLTENSDEETLHEYEKVETKFNQMGGYELEAKLEGILMGLGFSKEQMSASPLSLSGGWAMRLEMAKMLINEPNFMILDEPTNHLDLPSLIWFEKYLQSYKGTLLFVSHDKDLLNRLATMTMHLNQGRMRVYKGNYDHFVTQKAERETHDASTIENLKKKREQLALFVSKYGAKATKAAQARSKEKIIAKIDEEIQEIVSDKDKSKNSMVIKLPAPPPCDKIVYSIEDGAIGYKEILFNKINLSIEKGHKIAVIGANGIGKSTLLKTIAQEIKALNGTFEASKRMRLAYFSQNLIDGLAPNSKLLDTLLENPDITYQEARNLLGSLLFTKDDLEKNVSVLSGGEKNRLALACVLAKKANFLLLDEPTNHLDIASVNALVEALKKYEGTVLFVSHNRFFINEISSHVLALSRSKRAEIFEGKLEDYARLAPLANFPNVLEENTSSNAPKKEATTESKEGLSFSERKMINKEINRLEKQVVSYNKELEKLSKKEEGLKEKILEERDYEALAEIQKEIDTLGQQKDKFEEKWLEASDELESLKEKI